MADGAKQYDLEERTYEFARDCRAFIRKLLHTVTNIEDAKQLTRSSGSVAANYIEANEALSRKDFLHRSKICRKEAKESRLWLRLMDTREDQTMDARGQLLIQEAVELMSIFGAIVRKTEKAKQEGI